MRALATVRTIESISPIENADAIDIASIGGWNVVVKKGVHSVGEQVVYLEIDSWIPENLAPFLNTGSPARTYEDVVGYRLRTKKLRGVVSQGLILSLEAVAHINVMHGDIAVSMANVAWNENDDVTELLNVKKYEKALAANLAGVARGNFPSFIPKTDQERIQNLKRDLEKWNAFAYQFEVTEKADGSSSTIYRNDNLIEDGKDPIGVCSRNLDLKETEGNTFWQVARKDGIIQALVDNGQNLAIQGEVVGPSVQGNQYKLLEPTFLVFDIFDIDSQEYYTPDQRRAFCAAYQLKHVPVIECNSFLVGQAVQDLLTMAEGESKLNASGNSTREGLVFKCINDPSISFKVISNKWLLKYEE